MSYTPYKPAPAQAPRQGSTDALKIPSLSTGKPYTRPVAQCVGLCKGAPAVFAR